MHCCEQQSLAKVVWRRGCFYDNMCLGLFVLSKTPFVVLFVVGFHKHFAALCDTLTWAVLGFRALGKFIHRTDRVAVFFYASGIHGKWRYRTKPSRRDRNWPIYRDSQAASPILCHSLFLRQAQAVSGAGPQSAQVLLCVGWQGQHVWRDATLCKCAVTVKTPKHRVFLTDFLLATP